MGSSRMERRGEHAFQSGSVSKQGATPSIVQGVLISSTKGLVVFGEKKYCQGLLAAKLAAVRWQFCGP